MSGIFDALPGVETPVSSISGGLAEMWAETAAEGRPAPDKEHAKAIQVNFILHLGLNTDPADAVRQFDVAVNFSRRHPSRVVVLCPLADETGAAEMRAKVYGECTVGKTPEDRRCCEFVMLSYPRSARVHLQNQVSICLSTDIPVYYWAHRFSAAARLIEYDYLLSTARRVIIDSATAPTDAIGFAWPDPGKVRDLAFARLLPLRQSIGQFLSRYPADALSTGLKSVTLNHGSEFRAEARVLLEWLRSRLEACGAHGESLNAKASESLHPRGLELKFAYDGKKEFAWTADIDASSGTFEANFGTGRTKMAVSASLLGPESALSEAMFF